MTEEQKQKIRDNAWSLPPDQEPTGKLLFSEERNGEVYHYYESDNEDEYIWDTESYKTYRTRRRDEKKRKAAERRRRLRA